MQKLHSAVFSKETYFGLDSRFFCCEMWFHFYYFIIHLFWPKLVFFLNMFYTPSAFLHLSKCILLEQYIV